MTTDLTKTQLNTVLSALDGKPRNPNTKAAALKDIADHRQHCVSGLVPIGVVDALEVIDVDDRHGLRTGRRHAPPSYAAEATVRRRGSRRPASRR